MPRRVTSCRALRARGGWAEDAALRRCTFPIGPRNTYSNVAYLLAGIWVVVTQPDTVRWVMGPALAVLALGSALYHGTKRVWANNLDWVGMYACLSVLVVHGVFRDNEGVALGALSLSTTMALLWPYQPTHFDWHMGLLFVAALIPAYLIGHPMLALYALLAFAVSYLAWQADKRRWKVVGLWGHAIWHVGTAVALALLFAAQAK
jgi:hypothetical protein